MSLYQPERCSEVSILQHVTRPTLQFFCLCLRPEFKQKLKCFSNFLLSSRKSFTHKYRDHFIEATRTESLFDLDPQMFHEVELTRSVKVGWLAALAAFVSLSGCTLVTIDRNKHVQENSFTLKHLNFFNVFTGCSFSQIKTIHFCTIVGQTQTSVRLKRCSETGSKRHD